MVYDVCIIGSGQSGLVTCKTFSEKNKNVIVLEKSSNFNGMFHEIKETNYFKWSTSRTMSGFSDFPMDKSLPHWFTIQDYIDYLSSYKTHFNLEKYIQYNSNVIKCEYQPNAEWIVTYETQQIGYNQIHSLKCKKLIVCTGLNQYVKFPQITNNFTGKIIHTKDVYKMSKNEWDLTFSNKRVLLIGGGESAFDIGHIITQRSKNIYFTTKSYIEWFPEGVINKDQISRIQRLENKCFMTFSSEAKTPTDTNLLYAEYSLPEPISELWHRKGRWLLQSIFGSCTKCSHQHSKLCDKTETPDDLFIKYVVKRTDFMLDIFENNVNIIKYPYAINNRTVYSTDGEIEVDIIVCATGFKKTFQFLDEKIVTSKFIKKIIPEKNNNIAFVGFARPTMGSISAIAEMQSWWVYNFFGNTLNYKIRTPLFRMKDPLDITNDNIDTVVIGCYYLKDLAKDMNIEPNMVYLFFTDNELFRKIYTGSCHPMIYRIHGDKYYNGSRDILINTFVDFNKDRSFLEKVYFYLFLVFHLVFIISLFVISYLITSIFYYLSKTKTKHKNKKFVWLFLFLTLLTLFYK